MQDYRHSELEIMTLMIGLQGCETSAVLSTHKELADVFWRRCRERQSTAASCRRP
jgi:hypothetical protein